MRGIYPEQASPTEPARRPKVLHLGKFYPPHRGGMESNLKTVCDELLSEIDLEVIVSNTIGKTVREIVDGVQVTRIARLAQLHGTSVNPAMIAAIRNCRADLIHLHWPNPMAALAYLLSGHRSPLVLSYHSDVIRQRLLSEVFRPLIAAILERSRAILVSSTAYLETSVVLSKYRSRCHVVIFGIPDSYFLLPDPVTVQKIESEYGHPLVLTVGRLVDYKGFGDLIQAMVSTQARLLIAGTGPLQAKLSRLVHSLQLERRVIFLGELSDEDLRAYYHASDIFVLASTNRRESFGLVQVEAMAASKPVINTQLDSGVSSVSLDEVTGLTVPPSDPLALSVAINRLLGDARARQTMGKSARHRAETVFRSAHMRDQLLTIYRRVLTSEHSLTGIHT